MCVCNKQRTDLSTIVVGNSVIPKIDVNFSNIFTFPTQTKVDSQRGKRHNLRRRFRFRLTGPLTKQGFSSPKGRPSLRRLTINESICGGFDSVFNH